MEPPGFEPGSRLCKGRVLPTGPWPRRTSGNPRTLRTDAQCRTRTCDSTLARSRDTLSPIARLNRLAGGRQKRLRPLCLLPSAYRLLLTPTARMPGAGIEPATCLWKRRMMPISPTGRTECTFLNYVLRFTFYLHISAWNRTRISSFGGSRGNPFHHGDGKSVVHSGTKKPRSRFGLRGSQSVNDCRLVTRIGFAGRYRPAARWRRRRPGSRIGRRRRSWSASRHPVTSRARPPKRSAGPWRVTPSYTPGRPQGLTRPAQKSWRAAGTRRPR